MNQGKHGPVQGIGHGLCLGWFSFRPNAASNPAAADITGPLKRFVSSIAYSATGIQTVSFTADFVFATAPRFVPVAESVDLSSWFSVIQTGAYASRTLTLQQHRSGTAREVASDAANVIRVYVFAQDTTGK
jgi:hypothetical protein